MSDSQNLIAYAQAYLRKQPFDIVHDFEHHQLVVQNCLDIVTHEHLTPDEEVLLTSAWWHDVEKSYQTAQSSDNTVVFLTRAGQELKADPAFVEKCCQTIAQHSYSQRQTTLEGKILFDADKIEYVSSDRIKKLVVDFQTNPEKYQITEQQKTHDIWIDRIQKVPAMMHYSYSKKVFEEHLAATRTVLAEFRKAILG